MNTDMPLTNLFICTVIFTRAGIGGEWEIMNYSTNSAGIIDYLCEK